MWPFKNLIEYEEMELIKELDRRQLYRCHGVCDYCGKTPIKPPCKFPDRHYDKQTVKVWNEFAKSTGDKLV